MNESTICNLDTHLPSIEEATANALLAIVGSSSPSPFTSAKSALEELTRRNNLLIAGGDEAIIAALARQATLLEALVSNLLIDASRASCPTTIKFALNSALSAQRSLIQTLGALHQVKRSG